MPKKIAVFKYCITNEKACSGIDNCNWVMCISAHYTDLALWF